MSVSAVRRIGAQVPSTSTSGTSPVAPYVLAPLPNGGDDYATIQAFINTNVPLGLEVRFPLATYLFSAELSTPANVGAGRVIGVQPQGRNATGTIFRATTLGMRSVLATAGDSHLFEGICFDANFRATNAVYLNGTNWGTWKQCSLLNAFKHGITNNPASGNQGHHFTDCYFGNNGALYTTAGLAAQFTNGVRITIAGTATTNSGVALVTFAGLAIDLTTIAAKDDFLVVGNALATAQVMMIQSVTANTVTVQGNFFNLPNVSAAGQAFAIGSGDGVHEATGGAVGVNVYDKCTASGSGGSGFRFGGLYGSHIIAGQADFNNLFGVSIGRADNVSAAVLAPSIRGLYLEANFGTAGFSYFLGGATGLEITPAPSGAASMTTAGALLATGTIDYGSGAESIQVGGHQNLLLEFRRNAGVLQHRVVSDHWGGYDPIEADRIIGHSAAWTNTPTLNGATGFAAGVGIYDAGGFTAAMLNVAKPQNQAPSGTVDIEFNNTGTDYETQLTTNSINVNGVTFIRPSIWLTLVGVNTSISAATLAVDGKIIGFRIDMKIR